MSKQKTQVTTLALPITAGETSESSNLLKKYLFHWPLFLLGCIIFMVLAFFYIKTANPVYPILATIEFKSPTASSASLTVNQSATDQTLDPINKPIIVENEIEVMQSKRIIYQVVNDLQLWVTYQQKTGFTKKDLYKSTPVKFSFVNQNGNLNPTEGEKLKIKIKDQNSFVYTDPHNGDMTVKFSTPVKSDFGTWELTANPNVSTYVDSTLLVNVEDPDLVTEAYQKNIKVVLENKDAPFVNLSTSDVVPQRGKDVLNLLMNLYLEYAAEDKTKLSQKALKFVNLRIDSLKNDVDDIEQRISNYKTSHGITNIGSQAQGYRDTKQANDKAINDVQLQLDIVQSLERYAKSSGNADRLPPASAALGDINMTSLYDKLSDLQVKREEALATLPPTNPAVKTLDAQITSYKNDFKEKLESIKGSLLAQKSRLELIGKNLQSSLLSIPNLDREYASLERLQTSKDTIYKFLLQKKEQLALRYASVVSDSEIIDDAHSGKIKWPIVPVVYGLALILGLGSAAGILYMRESLNDLITNRSQVEDGTAVPILGELAFQDTDKQIVVSEGRSKFAIGEQFRVLRTNLYHLHGNTSSGRVTLFTSSVSGEGKSFVSSNLAVTLAYASRKTIILEMDLRKPKVSINFGLSPDHTGISNYLSGQNTNLNELIQPSPIAGLDVLGCGSILPNPSELLEKEQLDELIAELRRSYDEIIIDSPPIHLVTDALVIARVADASLYVIRQGYTHKYELDFIEELNESKRFPKFTLIFNGVKADGSGYGGYRYGYSYYNSNSYNAYTEANTLSFGERLKEILKRF